jgi:hypothetical protein
MSTTARLVRPTGALTLLLPLFSVVVAGMGACVSPGPAEPENKKGGPAAPLAEPPRAVVQINPDGRYTLLAVGANKCVQPAAKSLVPGARAQIAPCDGSPAQQYRLQALPGSYYAIVNAASDMCLDVSGASTDNGSGVLHYPCRSGLNQQWILADAPAGTLRLAARHSGKVMDVQGAVAADGTPLIQWPYSGDPNQRFKLTPAEPAPLAKLDGGANAGAAVAAASEKDKDKAKGEAKPKGSTKKASKAPH